MEKWGGVQQGLAWGTEPPEHRLSLGPCQAGANFEVHCVPTWGTIKSWARSRSSLCFQTNRSFPVYCLESVDPTGRSFWSQLKCHLLRAASLVSLSAPNLLLGCSLCFFLLQIFWCPLPGLWQALHCLPWPRAHTTLISPWTLAPCPPLPLQGTLISTG